MIQDQTCWVDRRRDDGERDEDTRKGAGLGDITSCDVEKGALGHTGSSGV
jgi:hypothetical protein